MKLWRRAFLQLSAGFAGGILFTPLPWKLADDSAIWSQNWRWRPSPERGEITKVTTICSFCDGGCGIRARLVDGKRAILIEGNPAHPLNEGGICPLGAAGLQYLYAPYRINKPMKQTKKRGDASGFKEIPWAEALAEFGKKLAQLRSDGKAHTAACLTRRRRSSMDELWRQFFNAYGSPNLYKMPSQADSLKAAALLTLGKESPISFALEKASYVLSFGAGLVEGWGALGRMQTAYRRWRGQPGTEGAAKVVQVESRCSLTASKADAWVAVAPGTEAALAMSIAHVMVKEKLYDADFVGGSVFGFEDWTDSHGKKRQGFKTLVLAPAYSPEEAAKRTGVDAGKIRELAKEFASTKNAVAVWGETRGDLPNNIYHDLCYIALNALKGNLGQMVGLVPETPLAELPEVRPDALAEAGLEKQRLDVGPSRKAPLVGNGVYGFLDAVKSGGRYPIEVLMVHEANPVYSLPESKLARSAFDKIGYVVSMSSFLDETALQADLLLPSHIALEAFDDVIGLPGTPYAYYAVSAPILKPQKDTKPAGDIVLQIAKAVGEVVGSALPWASYEEYLKARVKGLAASGKGAVADKKGTEIWKPAPGGSVASNYKDEADLWKKLAAGNCWYDAPIDLMNTIKTSSGKVELACALLQEKGLTGAEDQVYLPHYAPLAPSGDEKEYPLLLVGYETASLANDYLPNPPFMTKTLFDFTLKHDDQFVEINPATATSMGMNEGDAAVLKTPQGEVKVRAHLTAAARPGVVYIAQGLGHKAYDEYIQNKGVNANNVIEVQMDPVTGMGTVWATRAQLRRA